MLKVGNVKITDVDSGWDKLAVKLKEMSENVAVVGIQANEDALLLTIANVQEFGAEIPVTDKMRGFFRFKFGISLKKSTTVIKIPPRPFIRQTFDKRQAELMKTGVELAGLMIDDKLTVQAVYEIWGDQFVSFIRDEIAEGNNFEPNAPLTVMNKGKGKHPLQDEGRLQQAIKAVVQEV